MDNKPVEEKTQKRDKELLMLADMCFFNVDRRTADYETYRSYYYNGSDRLKPRADINKIFGEINNMLSLVYSPDNMVLESIVDKTVDQTPLEQDIMSILYEKTHENIFSNRLELQLNRIMLGAIIDGISIVKIIWNATAKTCELMYVQPDNFGVIYESMEIDDEFQIFCHKTQYTEAEIKKNYPSVYKNIKKSKEGKKTERTNAVKLLTGTQTSSALVMENDNEVRDFKPESGTETYTVKELWRHIRGSWERAIIVEDFVVSVRVMTQNPFFILRPIETPNYFWGMPIIYQIKEIQDKRNDKLKLLDHAVTLLTNPPLIIGGYMIDYETALKHRTELREPGGIFVLEGSQGNVKIDPYLPAVDIPSLFQLLQYYDAQTQYITGINEIMMGEAQKNVRSQGYAHMLAEFASTELKKTAHTLEGQLEEIFTFIAQTYQSDDSTMYQKNGNVFLLAQFSHDFRIEIFAHSGSPISMENNTKFAFALLKEGLMPPKELIKILPLPDKAKIIEYIEKKEKMDAEEAATAQIAAKGGDTNGKSKKGQNEGS